jgi:septal ring factor EnvC (AmiA/AmiB activator)
METIKNLIAKPAPWLYFVLVVALLIIVMNKSGTVNDLEASLDNANAEILASETLTESLSNEIALRNDAIAGLETAIVGWEADAIEVNTRLNAVDSDKGALEVEVGTLTGLVESLQTQLSTCTEASTVQ